MSNAYIQRPTGGGGGGGANTIFTQDGTATSIGDAFILSGYDIPDDDISGIIVKGGASTHTGFANQLDVDLTNRFHGTNIYSDALTHTLAFLPIGITNGTLRLLITVCVFDVTASITSTLRFDVAYQVVGGVNTPMPDFIINVQQNPLFTYGTVNVTGTVPGQIQVNVSGNGNTINWSCVGTYVQVGT